jgi:hypothetical protein
MKTRQIAMLLKFSRKCLIKSVILNSASEEYVESDVDMNSSDDDEQVGERMVGLEVI